MNVKQKVARIIQKEIAGLTETAGAGDAWWSSQSPTQQKAYIKAHPNSKYAKKAGAASGAPKAKAGYGAHRQKLKDAGLYSYNHGKNIMGQGVSLLYKKAPFKEVHAQLKDLGYKHTRAKGVSTYTHPEFSDGGNAQHKIVSNSAPSDHIFRGSIFHKTSSKAMNKNAPKYKNVRLNIKD